MPCPIWKGKRSHNDFQRLEMTIVPEKFRALYRVTHGAPGHTLQHNRCAISNFAIFMHRLVVVPNLGFASSGNAVIRGSAIPFQALRLKAPAPKSLAKQARQTYIAHRECTQRVT
jgi:hypothetical protein